MYSCQFLTGATGTKVCKYNQPCDTGGTVTGGVVTGGGGFIVVDPSSGAPSTSILPWVDGIENETAGANFNPELRAVGNTPLAGAARTAAVWYANVRDTNADSKIACRPYVLVQMTDGEDTCENNNNNGGSIYNNYGPVAAAQDFVSVTSDGARVPNKVYVIGLAATGALQTELNAIAYAGGSSAARFATTQADIEAALADIVASSVLIEKCNYVDDDCNGFVDEEYPDVLPSPTPNPFQFGRPCQNSGVGHCDAIGRFKCSTDQLSETCGPASCRLGAGTSLTKVDATHMALNGVSAFARWRRDRCRRRPISIVSARLAVNNGSFQTTAVTGTGTNRVVTFTNAAGVAENNPAGYELYCAAQVSCRQGNGTSLTRTGHRVTRAGVAGFTARRPGRLDHHHLRHQLRQRRHLPHHQRERDRHHRDLHQQRRHHRGQQRRLLDQLPLAELPPRHRRQPLGQGRQLHHAHRRQRLRRTSDAETGSTITISSATNPGNNVGNFVISAFVSTTSVTLTNPNGVNEAGAVQWNIYCANAESLGGCKQLRRRLQRRPRRLHPGRGRLVLHHQRLLAGRGVRRHRQRLQRHHRRQPRRRRRLLRQQRRRLRARHHSVLHQPGRHHLPRSSDRRRAGVRRRQSRPAGRSVRRHRRQLRRRGQRRVAAGLLHQPDRRRRS